MLEIQKQFINYNRSSRSGSIKYIVIHSTGNTNDTAQNNHDYFASGNRGASADFFVDDNDIIQIIDSNNYYSWHCGDGHGVYGISNSNSIGIEMCGTDNGNISNTTVNNVVDLVKYLMNKYGVDSNHVVRHYDASRKSCPSQFMNNNWARWYDFKERLSSNNAITGKWILDQKGYWYKYSDGSYPKDCWRKIDNKWFLFSEDGYMKYGWQGDNNKWYYFGSSSDGAMKTGWQLIDGSWYLFNENGEMLTGWKNTDSKWYYLNADGKMATGWIKDNEKDYCLYSSGAMICNCDMYGYRFDSNGVATKI